MRYGGVDTFTRGFSQPVFDSVSVVLSMLLTWGEGVVPRFLLLWAGLHALEKASGHRPLGNSCCSVLIILAPARSHTHFLSLGQTPLPFAAHNPNAALRNMVLYNLVVGEPL